MRIPGLARLARLVRLPRPLVAVALAGGLTATACSSDDSAKSAEGTGTGVERALASVPASADMGAIDYVDSARVRPLAAKDRDLYVNLAHLGIPEAVESPYAGTSVRARWGFTEKDVTSSVSVTAEGSTSVRLTGTFDADAMARKLKKQGYRADSGDEVIRVRGTGDDKSETYELSSSVRVHNPDTRPRLSTTAPKKSAADDPAYAKAADCLGDVYEATFYSARRSQDVRLMAIGGRIAASGRSSETLCAVTSSKRAARAVAKKLREKTRPGARYAGSKVTIGEGATPLVFMTWKNDLASGRRPAENNRTGELPMLLAPPS
ncbi:hypothetical protein [Streptomyces sp. NPDC059009]|uniref:hypothetical protein n=1 Tax=Streptomyces sp. NPDC059009 TaxID=3346694 RepID=UPI0036CD534C